MLSHCLMALEYCRVNRRANLFCRVSSHSIGHNPAAVKRLPLIDEVSALLDHDTQLSFSEDNSASPSHR
jgi:hypothetical protein